MTGEPQVLYRVGAAADSTQVAALHADSWRRHYRGAYSDAYLDGDIVAERMEVWAGRMAELREDQFTLLAQTAGRLVGFVHTVLDADPIWGALIDNLHVTADLKRNGIGSALLQEAAGVVVERRPSSGLFLWVHEQNVAAQRFYAAMGGVSVELDLVAPPGGDPTRLNGHPTKLRYAWSNPATLAIPQ
jgi:ribosomal protein S18 acetylase RimI-like enzyme